MIDLSAIFRPGCLRCRGVVGNITAAPEYHVATAVVKVGFQGRGEHIFVLRSCRSIRCAVVVLIYLFAFRWSSTVVTRADGELGIARIIITNLDIELVASSLQAQQCCVTGLPEVIQLRRCLQHWHPTCIVVFYADDLNQVTGLQLRLCDVHIVVVHVLGVCSGHFQETVNQYSILNGCSHGRYG